MGVNIATLLVFGVLIVVLGLMSEVSVGSNVSLSLESTAAVDRRGEQARTDLEVVSAQGGADNFTLQIKNTGLTSIYDYANMDLIVDYTLTSDVRVITSLTYTTGTLGDNEWKRTSLTPDNYQPNAWDPTEIITIDAKISPSQKSDSQATVTVSTPNGISATVVYAAKGFFWFIDAIDISLSATASWQDIDLSAYVPTGTTGAIVEVINIATSGNLSGLVRGKEDARAYMSDAEYEQIANETHRWQIVKVDSNRLIQGYIEDVQIDFKLKGYTLGSDPSYFANAPDVTPSTEDEWTDVDVTANVDSDTDGVILFITSTSNVDRNYGVRPIGSTFNVTTRDLDGYENTMYLVAINSENKFAVYHGDFATTKFYLIAQTKGSVVYFLEEVAITAPTTGSWQELDADDYNVPAAANGLFFRIMNADSSDRVASIRHADSTDSWTPDSGTDTHFMAGVGLRPDNVWDHYIEHADVEFHIPAYTVPLDN